MGKLQLKRSENDVKTYTPSAGEPIVDLIKQQIRIGDGTLEGGFIPKELYTTPLTAETSIAAEENTCVVVDCRENSINITLPAVENLPSGTVVKILDAYYASSSEKTITVSSTAKINDVNEDFVIDIPRAFISFVYVSETQNWLVDLGGIIIPSYEIALSGELEWNTDGQLSIKSVSMSKLVGELDLGEF